MARRVRADLLLVERGLAESRARAQAEIMAGTVFSAEQRVGKPGDLLREDAPLEVRGAAIPWVSRGGLKLEHGLGHFALDPAGRVAIDVGASTGGFTDVLLTHGAARVHAIDVGRGQLAWKLAQDPRVVVHDQMNARHLTAHDIGEPFDVVTCDASFIPLALVLAPALALAAAGAWAVALIKPQFEVGRERVGKGGVVRDAELHQEVCASVAAWLGGLPGWRVLGVTESPVLGPKGNREFLIAARKDRGART